MSKHSNEPRSLFFDPDEHPDNTLKAFNEFTQMFELRYNAQYTDPPKVSIESAIERWKLINATEIQPNPKPTVVQYDQIRAEWRSKDRVTKFLGMFSSSRLYTDWQAALPNARDRDTATWQQFLTAMQDYYKPTENPTLKNYQFRALAQETTETFPAFCNRVAKEAKHCHFNCAHNDCTAEQTATRDQIIIGTTESSIREEALLRSWDLRQLRQEGMKMESAYKTGAEITGEAIRKVGRYAYANIKHSKTSKQGTEAFTTPKRDPIRCYCCGNQILSSITKHRAECPAKHVTCHNCEKTGHFAKLCKGTKTVRQNQIENDNDSENQERYESYNINIFRTKKSEKSPHINLISRLEKKDLKVEVIVNNNLGTVIADTGARVSVCGTKQAKTWSLLEQMIPTKTKIKPYNSKPIDVYGIARCAVTFGATSIPCRMAHYLDHVIQSYQE